MNWSFGWDSRFTGIEHKLTICPLSNPIILFNTYILRIIRSKTEQWMNLSIDFIGVQLWERSGPQFVEGMLNCSKEKNYKKSSVYFRFIQI